ncbi:PAS domain S-box protein [Noviherbaspirillum sp. 1P10PC]|uniref:PAS domain S-box protein n=1 Tax=Noviherbaspirillum sp. 1P10PC TaxID=3132292 RepID=UPI0039A23DBB
MASSDQQGQPNFDHPPTFRAAVALAAHKGDQSAEALALRFGVTPQQVLAWHDELLEHAGLAFQTEGEAASVELFDHAELALTIAENSTQGFAMMDQRGYCLYANRAWLEMTGYTVEEIRSRPLHDLVHHHYPDGRPYPMEACPIDRALPERFDVRAHEDLFFRKDGSTFHVLCAASPIFRRGVPVATVIEIRDITEQKQIEWKERQAIRSAIAAAEANAKYRTFFEQDNYFACVMLPDGTLIEANRLSVEGCGFRREDMIGRKFWEGGWWSRSDALMKQVRAGALEAAEGHTVRFETRYFIADGSQRMADLVLSPVTDDAGQVLFVAPTAVDITESKRVEQRLSLLDTISQATRNALDARTIMADVTRLVGVSLDVTRCAYADVEADNDQFTIRHDWTAAGAASTAGVYSLNLFGQRAAQDMRSGRTLVIRNVDAELAIGDGAAMFNVIGIKAIICCPLVKAGKLAAMMAVHHALPRNWTADEIALVEALVDRSWAHIERVRSNEALRRNETHLLSLFEQTAAGIAESDLAGRIVNANERYCRMLGRSRAELIGRSIEELTHPDDLALTALQFQELVRDGKPFEIEKRYLRADGAAVWANTAVSLIRDSGSASGDIALAVVLDITERKRAEEKLKEADRRKDEFLAMLAHELRNPLAPIGAAADLLRLTQLDEARLAQTSAIISRQVRHMTGLIDDLLDVSRVTRGLVKLSPVNLDVRTIVSDAVEQVRAAIEARRHHLTVQLAPESALVWTDRKRMVQVLVNLLHNAVKYTPEEGSIVVSIDVQPERVLFAVQDNGIGMSAELISSAFDLFTQAERSLDRSQGGLGIGLALVRSLVELHRGTVCAQSAGRGLGSRFTVSLPRLGEPLRPAGAWQEHAIVPVRQRALTILIVDDNADAAAMLAMFLEGCGHRVLVEHDSHAALERAGREAPDACLLDIGLPGLDGNALARALRAQPRTASALLIAVTGYGQERDRREAMAAGFDHHFVKPVDTADILALLKTIN